MIEDFLIAVISLSSLVLPSSILISYIFYSRRRCTKPIGIILVMLIVLSESILGCKIGLHSPMFRLIEFVPLPLYFMISCAFINAQPVKLIFTLLLATSQFMGIRGIAAFLASHFWAASTENILYSWSTIIIQSCLYILLLPMTISLTKNCRKLIAIEAPDLWSILWLIPLTALLPICLVSGNLNSNTCETPFFLLARSLLLVSSFLIHNILAGFIRILQEQLLLKETNQYHEKIIDLQRHQYSILQTQMEETRRARHDLRQHLNLIQAYLDTQNHEALQSYIDKYAKTLPKITIKTYCKNYAVDTIIRYYAEQAELNGILFDCQLNLPQILPIEEPDICILFGNLIENAIETCEKLPPDSPPPFVRIRAQISGDSSYSITVDNTCAQAPCTSDSGFLSSKRNGPGMGTISIKHIAQQYNGLADFRYDNGIFYASVFLNPHQTK